LNLKLRGPACGAAGGGERKEQQAGPAIQIAQNRILFHNFVP
jgi:hypothetical protein